jgi:hypothetical protein
MLQANRVSKYFTCNPDATMSKPQDTSARYSGCWKPQLGERVVTALPEVGSSEAFGTDRHRSSSVPRQVQDKVKQFRFRFLYELTVCIAHRQTHSSRHHPDKHER